MNFELSITNKFHNKDKKPAVTNHYKLYTTARLTAEQFFNHITSGNAFCPAVFNEGERGRKNFLRGQLISLDFDHNGMEEVMRIPFVRENALMVYATPSSTPESPRCRVVFCLDEPVTSLELYELLVKRLLHLFDKADPACKDGSRMFYGSETAEAQLFPAQRLLVNVIEALPLPEQTKRQKQALRKAKKALAQKAQSLAPEDAQKLKEIIRELLSYIPEQQSYDEWLSCLMAVHSVFPDAEGVQLIEAWSGGYDGEVEDKFASFDPEGSVTLGTLYHLAIKHGWTRRIHFSTIPDDHISVNVKYLSDADLSVLGRCSVIRSPMGSGKTHFAQQVIVEFELRHGRRCRVLVITHRTALARNVAERYGIPCYKDLIDQDEVSNLYEYDQLAITFNSLWRLENQLCLASYDIIIIDEIEQGINHLFGDTFRDNEDIHAFSILLYLIKSANTVLTLDAHASISTEGFLRQLRDGVQFIHNTYTEIKGNLTLYRDRNLLRNIAEEALYTTEGLPPSAYLSDSKSEVKALAHFWSTMAFSPDDLIAIHSDNSSNKDIQHFINNLETELPERKMLITSPTLGTGIDIQTRMETVIADFSGITISPEEMMQMIGRFRNGPEVSVHMPRMCNGHRETDPQKIEESYRRQYAKTWPPVAFDSQTGQRVFSDNQEVFLKLFAEFTARRNAQMNDAYPYFCELAKQNYRVAYEEGIASIDDSEYKLSKEELTENFKKLVLSARPIDRDEYEAHKKTGTLTEEIYASYVRGQMEEIYGEYISDKHYEDWDEGRGRTRLLGFMSLNKPCRVFYERDYKEEFQDIAIQNRGHHLRKHIILTELLASMFGETLHSNEIPKETFKKVLEERFMPLVQKYDQDLKDLFKMRADYSQQPKSRLNLLLKRVGLSVKSVPKGKSRKIGAYQIDPDNLGWMLKLAQGYARMTGDDPDNYRIISLNNQ
ncbi:MAG: plasmid replication protein, CyRepA1 family [Aggregatilineales bacterium]